MPSGEYELRFACTGDGTITVAFESLTGEPLPGMRSERCDNSVTSLTVVTTEDGILSRLSLEGPPTVFALSFQAADAIKNQ